MYIDTKAMIILVGIMYPKDCFPNMEMNSVYIKNVLSGFFFFFLLTLPTFSFPSTKFIHIAALLGISMGMLDACVPSHV